MTKEQKINTFENRLDDFYNKYSIIDESEKAYCWSDHGNIDDFVATNIKNIEGGSYALSSNDDDNDDFSTNAYSRVHKYVIDSLTDKNSIKPESNVFKGAQQCHGFAEYISSLCSGEYLSIITNSDTSIASGSWMVFRTYNEEAFGGLRKGDFVRFNQRSNDPSGDQHSAIVHHLEGDNVIFLQTLHSYARVYTDKCFNYGKIKRYEEEVDVYTKADILANADFIARYVPGETIVTMTLDFGNGKKKKDQRIAGSPIGTLPYADDPNFDGWYIGNSKCSPTQEVIPGSTLTARWKPRKYYLQFDWKGADGKVNKLKIDYNENDPVTLDEIDRITKERIDYLRNNDEFKYWAKYENGKYVKLTGSIVMNSNITLYAIFRNYHNTIKYVNHDGKVLSSDETIDKKTYKIKSIYPTRTGYKFIGWKVEGCEDLLTSGCELNLKEFEDDTVIRLIAQWEELYFVMTFDTFGISEILPMEIPFSEIPLNQDGTKLLLTNAMFPWLGFTSYGWKIKGDRSRTIYRSGDELPIKSYDFELADACPFPNSNGYLVTFDANGGETAPSPQIMQPGGVKILTSEEPTRAYHHFIGWATSPNSATAEYAPGSCLPIYNSITLYAVWLGGGARIKYETGVSEIDPYPVCNLPVCQLYNFSCLSEGIRLSSQIPERPGYIFDGWSCDVPLYAVYDNAWKNPCYPADTVRFPHITEDNYFDHVYDTITLTAMWKQDPSFEREFPKKEEYWHKCKITFDANGGEETPEPQYVSMGACDILGYEEPTREYYQFMGWATAPDKYNVEYAPGSLIEPVNDMTLYAVWLGGCPRIRFESGVPRDCATPAYDMPKSMLYRMDYISGEGKLKLPDHVPSRIGFIFDGWECDKSYTLNDDGSICFDDISADDYYEHAFDVITFTAKWRPANEDQFYDVNFYDGYNGGNSLLHIKVRKDDRYCYDYSNGYYPEKKDLPTLHDFSDGVYYFAWGAPGGGVLTKDSIVSASGDHNIYAISFHGMPFTDMEDYHWAKKAVAVCKYLGYISGTSDTTYSPGAHATRYQAAAILSRGDGVAMTENNPFYDIKTDSDKNSVATWAWQNGIATGSNGAFLPDDIITRAELVAFLYRYAIHKGTISGGEVFDVDVEEMPNDFNLVPDWAINPMKWALKNDIITKNDGGNIRPDHNVTRAELAVFMLRIFKYTGVIPYCY